MAEVALDTAVEAIAPDQPVSIEIDGVTLTGVGETEAELRAGLPAKTDPTPKKLTRGQERFSELTSQRDKARHEAQEAARERDEWKHRASTVPQPAAPPVVPVPPPARAVEAAVVPAAAFTFPGWEPWSVDHPDKTWDDWNDEKSDARADFKIQHLNVDAQIRRSIEADRASRTAQDRAATTLQRARAAYTDFDAVLSAPHATANNWPLEKLSALAGLDEPEHVQYALAKDPVLAERLRTEPNMVKFGIEVAKLLPGSAVASPASTAGHVAVLPPPMQPVGSGSKTAVWSAADLAERGGEDYDSSGFREQSRRERGRR